MLTRETVISGWMANGWDDLTVTCPDGTKAILTPCSMLPVIRSMDDVEYVLVSCDLPWAGDNSLDKVIADLNRHAELVAEQNDEKTKLRAFFDAHIADGNADDHTFEFYSDWHKDVYGYRPHGLVCGQYINPHATA